MNPIKLVLFDLDDTLVHFDDYWEMTVKETFRNHLITREMNINDLFEVFDEVDELLVGKLDSQQLSIHEYRIQRYLQSMDKMGKTADVEGAILFESLYQSIGKKNMKPNVIVNKLIAELSNHYQIGIITNGSKGWQLDKIEAIGLNDVFPKDYVFISEDIGYEKPSPEIYHHVRSKASLLADQILVVGDSWANDVMGPIQQGLKAIWFNKENKQVPQGAKPLAVITELEELRPLLLSQSQ